MIISELALAIACMWLLLTVIWVHRGNFSSWRKLKEVFYEGKSKVTVSSVWLKSWLKNDE